MLSLRLSKIWTWKFTTLIIRTAKNPNWETELRIKKWSSQKLKKTNIQHVIKEGNPSIIFSNTCTIQVYFHWHIRLFRHPLHLSNPSHCDRKQSLNMNFSIWASKSKPIQNIYIIWSEIFFPLPAPIGEAVAVVVEPLSSAEAEHEMGFDMFILSCWRWWTGEIEFEVIVRERGLGETLTLGLSSGFWWRRRRRWVAASSMFRVATWYSVFLSNKIKCRTRWTQLSCVFSCFLCFFKDWG